MAARLYPRALAFAIVALTLALSTPLPATQESETEQEQRTRVADLLKSLDVRPGALIADVGAGDGFYTVRIARAVAPGGRAVAVDIKQSALDKLHERVTREGVTNVEVILGALDDPHLGVAEFDAALIHNAYHEMTEHESMLAHIHDALKPGGRLVLVEPMLETSRGLPREQQVAHHNIAADIVEGELRAAGFEVVERHDEFVRYQGTAGWYWLIVARRAGVPQRPPGAGSG